MYFPPSSPNPTMAPAASPSPSCSGGAVSEQKVLAGDQALHHEPLVADVI